MIQLSIYSRLKVIELSILVPQNYKMRLLLFISILLLFASCEQNPNDKYKEEIKAERVESEAANKQKSERIIETKKIVAQNFVKPKARVVIDTISEERVAVFSLIDKIKCEKSSGIESKNFEKAFIDEYENSSTKSGKKDGSMFCLNDLGSTNDVIPKLVYNRSEGGEQTDLLGLMIAKPKKRELHVLGLVSTQKTEGYEGIIETRWDKGNIITRKITEILGWPEPSDPQGLNQPRSVTIQKYKLTKDWNIEFISEDISNHNFEPYMKAVN